MSQQNRQRKQLTTTKVPSSKRRNKFQLILALLLLAFVGVGSILLYNHHTQQLAIAKERAQFAQTEKDLDSTAIGIASTFGAPDVRRKDNNCGYASRDFGRGPLGCSVQVSLAYGADDKNESQMMVNKISSYLKQVNTLTYLSSSSALVDKGDPSTTAVQLGDEGYRESHYMLQCEATYYYYSSEPAPIGFPSLKNSKTYTTLVNLSCGGAAKAVYYPLSK